MKKIILLFLLLPVLSFAQSPFRKIDSAQFRKVVDMLISETGTKYIEEKDRQDWDENNLKFVNPEDKNDIVFIEYGCPNNYCSIFTVYGNYYKLFPIWKNHIDNNADIEKIKTKGFIIYNYSSFDRFEKNDYWRLSL